MARISECTYSFWNILDSKRKMKIIQTTVKCVASKKRFVFEKKNKETI